MKRFHKSIYLVALLLSPSLAAQQADRDAPAYIEANQVELREKENMSLYTGNVKITKGSIRITGEQIMIKNQAGKLQLIQIEGTPATFTQLNDLGEEIRAQSQQMEYRASNGLLELKQDALLEKNNNQFKSAHIIYDTRKDVIKAGQQPDTPTQSPSQEAPKPRVQITIQSDNQPEQKKSPTE